MVVRKRKKVTKYRAHNSHGGGHRKKRRGAGSRGGRGNAGTGKRAGHKKLQPLMGKHGFLPRRTAVDVNVVNVGYFTPFVVKRLVQEGKATQEGALYTIDLAKLGYQKLLGTGKTSMKLKLKVEYSSAHALEKIKAVGGDVITSQS